MTPSIQIREISHKETLYLGEMRKKHQEQWVMKNITTLNKVSHPSHVFEHNLHDCSKLSCVTLRWMCIVLYLVCTYYVVYYAFWERYAHFFNYFFFITMDCEWKSFSDLLFCWSVSSVPAIQTNTIKYRKEQFSHIKWLRSPINHVTYSSLFIIMQTVKTTY